jgi:hypothetical protein
VAAEAATRTPALETAARRAFTAFARLA